MDLDRRQLLQGLAGSALPGTGRRNPDHERHMWQAVEYARRNPEYPFGAVIVATRTGELLAGGANDFTRNPLLHGEIAAMNDYLSRYGNRGWADTTLYTTGEPCPMCTGALLWAGLGRIVWASSAETIRRTGIPQFTLSAREVATAAPAEYGAELLLGGVLAQCTDRLFEQAAQLRGA